MEKHINRIKICTATSPNFINIIPKTLKDNILVSKKKTEKKTNTKIKTNTKVVKKRKKKAPKSLLIQEPPEIPDILSFDSMLTKKLKEVFNEEEEEMFRDSFEGFLKYDQEKDFVVDFDMAWKWVGYNRKADSNID